jgi:uncharacterized protein YceK
MARNASVSVGREAIMRFTVCLALLGVFGVTGCSTIIARAMTQLTSEDLKIEGRAYRGVYPGVRLSYDFFIRHEELCSDPERRLSSSLRAPLAFFVGVPDLSASLAFDTAILPFDGALWLAATSAEDSDGPKEASQDRDTVFETGVSR